MPKVHYFQRYSSVENTVTNNTLQLLARVNSFSPAQASKLLTALTAEPIDIGIEIKQQERGVGSVPDGHVIQRSFEILIESKVDAPADIGQLCRHTKNFSKVDKKVLLLLTRAPLEKRENEDFTRKILGCDKGIIFKNITYEKICDEVDGLFEKHESEMQALVEDYIEYCNDAGLFDQSSQLMRIVPVGQSLKINKRYGIYFYPKNAGYTKHRFVGLYKDKTVQAIFEIDSVFDVEYDDLKLNKDIVGGRNTNEYDQKIIEIIKDAKQECGYEIGTGHRFFCGQPIETTFKKSSPGGIQGARFVNLRKVIGDFQDASDVAQKLSGKQWE